MPPQLAKAKVQGSGLLPRVTFQEFLLVLISIAETSNREDS